MLLASFPAWADSEPIHPPPAWLVPVVRVVSETHVVPTTGIAVGAGQVLVPSDFTVDDEQLVVLDGGADLVRNGRPAKLRQRFPLAGLALLDVPGLQRQAPVLAAAAPRDQAGVALLAFAPADRIRVGAPFVALRSFVRTGASGVPVIAPERPLPNLTGALVDACGQWVGHSAARGVASLSTNANTIYTWAPALRRELDSVGLKIGQAPCDATFSEPVPEGDADALVAPVVDETPQVTEPAAVAQASEAGTEPEVPLDTVSPDAVAGAEVPGPEQGVTDDGASASAGASTPPVSSTDTVASVAEPRFPWWVLVLLPLSAAGGWWVGRRSTAAARGASAVSRETPWRLVDEETGECFDVPARDGRIDCVLGRHDTDLLIMGVSVSRRHARLRGSALELAVLDLGSTNGTFVNDRRCDTGDAVRLVAGDRLRLGDRNFELEAGSGAIP